VDREQRVVAAVRIRDRVKYAHAALVAVGTLLG
jgi:hypothetical protein